ncbi:MAG: response regulator [Fibrobacteres bacterium]|nr:response regulator [Fibrobacterota bacterium]
MFEPSRVPKPDTQVRRKAVPVAKPGKNGGARPRETILLVEDERSVREFMARTLAKLGYRVLVAEDGESALTQSLGFAGEIHLLVTDVMMPNMNGKDLADRLCALRPRIRVLFVSGYSRADIWPDVCEDQTDWLPKPFTVAQFQRKVRHVLDSLNEA